MLYAYWGAVGDHNLNIPGHPLYQLYAIESIAKALDVQKVYFYSLLHPKLEASVDKAEFYINCDVRKEICQNLNIEIVSLKKALELSKTVDEVVLKARFRNKSRLQEGSYDALKFETLLNEAKNNNVYVLDSDGELPETFFDQNQNIKLLTYFQDTSFYSNCNICRENIYTILPALASRFADEIKPLELNSADVFFIGNEGLKSPELSGILQNLAQDGLDIRVQGKWTPKYDFKIYSRTERKDAYLEFPKALSTLQISKQKYAEYSFLSPRVYEALVCGVVPFIDSKYKYGTDFCKISGYIDLREKLKSLREGYSRDYKLVFDEIKNNLQQVENDIRDKKTKVTSSLGVKQ